MNPTEKMRRKTHLSVACLIVVMSKVTHLANAEFCMHAVIDGKFSTVKRCKAPSHDDVISELETKIKSRVKPTTKPATTNDQTKAVATTTAPATSVFERKTHILIGQRFKLDVLTLTATSIVSVVSSPLNVTNLTAVDYDPVMKEIYWTGSNIIRRAKPNDTESKTIISNVSAECDGIAVDWVARNLYWSDMRRRTIEVSRLDGSSRKTLVKSDIHFPRAIELDPAEGNMYWSDWGSVPKIEGTSLDGSDRRVLVNDSIIWPSGIAIDYKRRLLYWADAYLDKIEVVTLDGSLRLPISRFVQHIMGFTYLNDFIYWIDWQNATIERMSVTNLTFWQELGTGAIGMSVKAFDDTAPTERNDCSIANGDCSHLCFYTPRGRTCSCPDNYVLSIDQKTCNGP